MKKHKNNDDSIKIWGIHLFSRSIDQLLSILITQVEAANSPLLVVTPNPEQIIQAKKDARLHQILSQADLAIPDGVGLVKATQLLKDQLNGRFISRSIPGRVVVERLLKVATEKKWQVFVVGGQGYASQPGLEPVQLNVNGSAVWWLAGYENINTPTSLENAAVSTALHQLKPDIVFVAFGAPFQEFWLAEHRPELAANNVKVGMTVGGSFDTLLGLSPRPPHWMNRAGLEWLFRLVTQPWRWRRQLRLVAFMGLVFQTWWRRDAAKSQF